MRYGTISHTPNICHLHLENIHALMPIISKTSRQLRGFFLVSYSVCLSGFWSRSCFLMGCILTLCNYLVVILSKFLAHTDSYTIRGSQANRVSPQLCPWFAISPLPSLSLVFNAMFPAGSSHPLTLSMETSNESAQVPHLPLSTTCGHSTELWKYSSDALCFPRLVWWGSGDLSSTVDTDRREESWSKKKQRQFSTVFTMAQILPLAT